MSVKSLKVLEAIVDVNEIRREKLLRELVAKELKDSAPDVEVVKPIYGDPQSLDYIVYLRYEKKRVSFMVGRDDFDDYIAGNGVTCLSKLKANIRDSLKEFGL